MTPEQAEYVVSVISKIDLYADYIVGFMTFGVVVLVGIGIYKFFNIFF